MHMPSEGPENPYVTGIFGVTALRIIYDSRRPRMHAGCARFSATHQRVGKKLFHLAFVAAAHFSREAARHAR